MPLWGVIFYVAVTATGAALYQDLSGQHGCQIQNLLRIIGDWGCVVLIVGLYIKYAHVRGLTDQVDGWSWNSQTDPCLRAEGAGPKMRANRSYVLIGFIGLSIITNSMPGRA